MLVTGVQTCALPICFPVTIGVKREMTLDLEDFKSLCKNPQEHIADMLLAYRQGVRDEVNAKLTDSVIAYAGNYADGSDRKSVV